MPPPVCRQQLASLNASGWHVCDKAGCSIAQERALCVFRHLDYADADWFFGSAGVHQLYVVRPGICDRDSIGLNDARTFAGGYGVKVIRCELRVVFVERFRNLDHVGQASVDSGSVALVAFHVGELL